MSSPYILDTFWIFSSWPFFLLWTLLNGYLQGFSLFLLFLGVPSTLQRTAIFLPDGCPSVCKTLHTFKVGPTYFSYWFTEFLFFVSHLLFKPLVFDTAYLVSPTIGLTLWNILSILDFCILLWDTFHMSIFLTFPTTQILIA